jgi:Tfp pilus assembly protein PilO
MTTSKKSLLLTFPKDIKLQNILPRIEEEKTRSFITLSLTLIAIVIFGFFAISPTLSTISELTKQLDDNRFVDTRLIEKISNLSKLQQQYATLQSDFSYVFSAVPKETDIPQFIAQVQAISQQTQVQLVRIQTLPVEVLANPSTKYTSVGLGIDIVGQPTDTDAFLHSLSSFQRIITIDSITITKNSTSNIGDNSVRMSIKGKLYFQRG